MTHQGYRIRSKTESLSKKASFLRKAKIQNGTVHAEQKTLPRDERQAATLVPFLFTGELACVLKRAE